MPNSGNQARARQATNTEAAIGIQLYDSCTLNHKTCVLVHSSKLAKLGNPPEKEQNPPRKVTSASHNPTRRGKKNLLLFFGEQGGAFPFPRDVIAPPAWSAELGLGRRTNQPNPPVGQGLLQGSSYMVSGTRGNKLIQSVAPCTAGICQPATTQQSLRRSCTHRSTGGSMPLEVGYFSRTLD